MCGPCRLQMSWTHCDPTTEQLPFPEHTYDGGWAPGAAAPRLLALPLPALHLPALPVLELRLPAAAQLVIQAR